jgi:hypothetical protein
MAMRGVPTDVEPEISKRQRVSVILLPRYCLKLSKIHPGAMRKRQTIAGNAHLATSCFIALGLTALASAQAAEAFESGPAIGAAREVATHAWAVSYQWATENYGRNPGLMVGLAAVLLLPPLALASGLISRLALPRQTCHVSRFCSRSTS